jgi:hypothetical protein
VSYLYSHERDQRPGLVRDWSRWLRMPTHRFRRQWWGGCSMGPSLDAEKWGTIVGLKTARKDTTTDQRGLVYALIRYDDGTLDRVPRCMLYHYAGKAGGFFSHAQ